MGRGMEYRCSSCGNTYYACFGVGMFFPQEYAKVLRKIKNLIFRNNDCNHCFGMDWNSHY